MKMRTLEKRKTMDEARTNGAVVEWGCTHLFLYRGVGRSYFFDAATREEAEKAAVKYTHLWWDDYLTAPCYIEYSIINLRSGEEIEYREVCGPKQEDEPECADEEGHKWVTINDEKEEETEDEDDDGTHMIRPFSDIDRCAKCGRYRVYYRAEPERGLPRFFKYSAARAK